MGRRRKAGKYPYDYTAGDDGRFAESGLGGTLRVLHGPGRGMGVPEGVACRVEVLSAHGTFLDESHEGKFGKEHRLHGTAPGDRITVEVAGRFADGDELTTGCAVELTGDLDDVVRFGVGPAWSDVEAIDTGERYAADDAPTAAHWGAGVRIRGGRRIGGQ
jgi:hypothetical protein